MGEAATAEELAKEEEPAQRHCELGQAKIESCMFEWQL